MADTYAFALGGALLLALTVSPVLCLWLLRRMKPAEGNFVVRFLRDGYIRNLAVCLKYRWLTVALFAAAITGTYIYAVPKLGREFMPELEEGNLWIRAIFPLNASLDNVAGQARKARQLMSNYPEVESVVSELGRPDDGTDPGGFYNVEFFVPLRPEREWPKEADETGWRRWFTGDKRARRKAEIVKQMNDELGRAFPGVDWGFSQNIRDNVMEAMSGVKGNNSVKIFGPDLQKLEDLAAQVRDQLRAVRGIKEVGVFNIKGNTNLEFRIDPGKCKTWGVSATDVNNVVTSAIGGRAFSTLIEGERTFDISTRLPAWRRGSETTILDIPIDIINNQVILRTGPGLNPSPTGSGHAPPAVAGSLVDLSNPISTSTPRLLLRQVVSPVGPNGAPDPTGSFVRAGASTIYREQGQRMIAIKFSVRERDLGGAVDEAKTKVAPLMTAPYRTVWSGEFEQMEDAEGRLVIIIPASLLLIFLLLYIAFHSFIDGSLVLVNVLALSLGGIWALLLTDTNFSVSAAVGFVSIFGVAIMDGLLLVSYFNQNRAHGMPDRDAIMNGAAVRVRPVMMTALTAIFGLVPAALATRIGSQTQKPLAIVVIGGMATTLFLTRYLMPVLYSFYGHREPPAAGGMAH
jgi:cobalt-zinc-cadmium resistance protein CzcA